MADFHYDEQIRRFLLQFTRMFSNFNVEYSRDECGNVTLLRVPIRYGDSDRQAQHMLQKNSASRMPSAPLMTFYVTDFEYARDRVQEPYYTDKKYVRQRRYDEATGTYEQTQGNAFTVERVMPVPYNIGITLDIWTTNTNQKLQLLEQITPLFNPSLEIQSTDNYLDWTSLSIVELNRTVWSSRTIPVGTDEPIDIASLKFTLPVWISPPARVTKGGVIHKIITSIFNEGGDQVEAITNDDILLGTRLKVTPHGYQVLLIDNQLQILDKSAVEDPKNNSFDALSSQSSNVLWHTVIEEYGELTNGVSQIRLENQLDGSEIIGTVAFNPTDDKFIIFTVDIDTLPENTLDPIDAVVNPLRSGPGVTTGTTTFPSAASGQRYLLTEATGDISNTDFADNWEGTDGSQLIASANDIIEYDGVKWSVVLDASTQTTVDYITNITTDIQYKWTGTKWLRSYEGLYNGGNWSLVI